MNTICAKKKGLSSFGFVFSKCHLAHSSFVHSFAAVSGRRRMLEIKDIGAHLFLADCRQTLVEKKAVMRLASCFHLLFTGGCGKGGARQQVES